MLSFRTTTGSRSPTQLGPTFASRGPMTPSQTLAAPPHAKREQSAGTELPAEVLAEALLARHGRSVDEVPGAADSCGPLRQAALATAVMDEYRRTNGREAFECLVRLTGGMLLARVR